MLDAGVRVDFNSDIKDGRLNSTSRIDGYIPYLENLSNKYNTVYLMSHQGRSGREDFVSLRNHYEYVDRNTSVGVEFCEETEVNKLQDELNDYDSDVVFIENTRFFDDEVRDYRTPEEASRTELVRELSGCFDIFINDGFSVSHRKHATVIGFLPLMESKIGELFEDEVETLDEGFWDNERRCCIIGGAKTEDKCKYLCNFLENERVESILASGKVACVLLERLGYDVNMDYLSGLPDNLIDRIDSVISDYGDSITVPTDMSVDVKNERKSVVRENLGAYDELLDLGDKTIDNYKHHIKGCDAVLFAGPAGYYEDSQFERGTREILESVSNHECGIIAGGDSISASEKLGVSGFEYKTFGGGATLEYLSTGTVPGLKYIEKYSA